MITSAYRTIQRIPGFRKTAPDLPMISLDEIRRKMRISQTDNQGKVVEIARERARELLRKKQSFAWNTANISPTVRRKQIKLFSRYHASTRIVYLETTWEEQLRRNAGRGNAVPEQAIRHMLEELVLPEAKEAYRVNWYCI